MKTDMREFARSYGDTEAHICASPTKVGVQYIDFCLMTAREARNRRDRSCMNWTPTFVGVVRGGHPLRTSVTPCEFLVAEFMQGAAA